MRFADVKLPLKLICLTLNLGACAGSPPLRPHITDTQLREVREYSFTPSYNLSSQPIKIHDMSYANGMLCFHPGEAKAFKEWAKRKIEACESKAAAK